MRAWLLALLAAVALSGCTGVQLRRGTVRQVTTLTDLQHKLVLDNMAAFVCSPYAVPFQANLVNGTTQVVDTGFAQYITDPAAALFGISRTQVDQWGMFPVTDEVTLRLLRIAYRRALGFDEDLYTDDFANRLAHRLKRQVVSLADMTTETSIMYSRGPALPQLLDRAGWKGDMNDGFKSDDPAVQRWQKDTSDIIATNSDRLILIGERLTRETLAVTPVLGDGVPVVLEGEQTPRVKVATPLAAEVRRQILALNDYILQIQPGWFNWGCKRDIPPCVCYVGNRKDCDCNLYVWVTAENRPALEDFTLHSLRLIGLLQESNTNVSAGNVMYSPATNVR